jgi:protein-L-isoaspartate O-methyltransferase
VKNTLILLALVFIMLCISFVSHAQAMARQMRKRLAATDTTDIYSRSPLRPFRYGYPYDKAQCLKNFGLLSDAADFHEGDTIAEVGAASGWIEGVLSVLCDSLTLFAEDIDTDYLNQDQFNHVKVYFDQLRASPQTNKLYYIIGTLTNTQTKHLTKYS